MARILVMATDYFPFSGGEQFLETEIKFLAANFEKIYLIPINYSQGVRPLPENVELIDSFAKFYNFGPNKLRRLLNISGYPLILSNFKSNLNYLKILFGWSLKAAPFKRFMKRFMKEKKLMNPVLYTYWFNFTTFVFATLKDLYCESRVITRTHRGDLYHDLYGLNTLPFREETLERIDRVYSISEDGKKFLDSAFPKFKEKIAVARLGVQNPGFQTPYSMDNVLRLASCSFLTSVKRVELIIQALAALKNEKFAIEWFHIGDGPLMAMLEQKAKKLLRGSNISAHFLGKLENSEVIRFYKQNIVDAFINLSSSEGVPVSIMEAQSCSIPVVATNVGGVGEIVNEFNGCLVAPNPSPESVGEIIKGIFTERNVWIKKRELSYLKWRKFYDADANYHLFSKEIGANFFC